MKKSLIALNAMALLMSSLIQAGAVAEDAAATLNISGTVGKGSLGSCTAVLDKTAVTLTGNISSMANQNDPLNDDGQAVKITFTGSDECYFAAMENKLAYKFIGTADNAEGTVLANSDASYEGAQGIGIGVYDLRKKTLLKINQDSLPAAVGGSMLGLNLVKLTGQEVKGGHVQGSLTVQVERL